MSKLVPGTVVRISNLSQPSYFLYKSYLKYSPLLICPCHLKRDILLIVEEVIDDVVILKVKGRKCLTMTFKADLETVFEH